MELIDFGKKYNKVFGTDIKIITKNINKIAVQHSNQILNKFSLFSDRVNRTLKKYDKVIIKILPKI